jgi:hypothetical protein
MGFEIPKRVSFMPITIEWWDEARKIVLYRVDGYWSLEEAMQSLEKASMLSNPPPKLYLTDLRTARTVPFGVISRQDYISKYLRLTEGLTVVVGAHPLLTFFLNALVRLGVPIKNLVFVDTMDDAVRQFAKYFDEREL